MFAQHVHIDDLLFTKRKHFTHLTHLCTYRNNQINKTSAHIYEHTPIQTHTIIMYAHIHIHFMLLILSSILLLAKLQQQRLSVGCLPSFCPQDVISVMVKNAKQITSRQSYTSFVHKAIPYDVTNALLNIHFSIIQKQLIKHCNCNLLIYITFSLSGVW